jgi:hypothetical protein
MSVLPAIASVLLAAAQTGPHTGIIEGRVVNASRNDQPVAEAEVVLQVRIDGQFTAVEQTVSDAAGRFRFDSLPVDPGLIYLPGANRDGVHYPGRRIELTPRRPNGYLTLAVHEGIAEPNPLVVREHEIVIGGEPGVLHVVEAMLIENPGLTTYIGAEGGAGTPVTLSLGIPMDFERLTFQEEFFGRQFTAGGEHVVTSLPWTPGARWLRYTYSLPNEDLARIVERRLDLPTEHVRVRILQGLQEQVTCNLAAAEQPAAGEVAFENGDQVLPAGHKIQVTLGRLPLPWVVYARWSALALLLGLVGAAVVIARCRSRGTDTHAPLAAAEGGGPASDRHGPHAHPAEPSARRRGRRIGSQRNET